MTRFGYTSPIFPYERPTIADAIVLFFSELFATAILLFVGCMGCIIGMAGFFSVLTMSFAFGIAVLIAVQCFGHISGSHINPTVTIAAVALGHLPWNYLPIYIIGQILGALLGFGLLVAVTPSHYIYTEPPGLCSPSINANLSTIQAFFVEFLISLVLVLVCCGVWDKRNSNNFDSVSIRFGMTIAGLAISALPYTGAHMNPARTLAPAIINGDFKGEHWIYYVGPPLSSIVGGFGYRFLFTPFLDRQAHMHEGED